MFDCEDGGTDIAFVKHTINDDQRATIESWNQYDDTVQNFCDVDGTARICVYFRTNNDR